MKQTEHDNAERASLSTDGLGLSDRLRQWIPDGDGYNSEYANTLAEAADEIDRAQQCERECWRYADELEQERQRLQSVIDRLMLEYCPDEMTPEQIANWERHQKAVPNVQHEGCELASIPLDAPVGRGKD